jgi:hypothetical protein
MSTFKGTRRQFVGIISVAYAHHKGLFGILDDDQEKTRHEYASLVFYTSPAAGVYENRMTLSRKACQKPCCD